MSYWLAIGPADNWEIGIRKKIWGVAHAHSKTWGRVEPGDTVFFYAMTPVKGLIGYGVVSKTMVDEKPFWPQEVSERQPLWPFRMTFSQLTALPRQDWESKRFVASAKASSFSAPSNPSILTAPVPG